MADLGEGRQMLLAEQLGAAAEDGAGYLVGFGCRVDPGNHVVGADAKAIAPGGAGFVGRRRRPSSRSREMYLARTRLANVYLSEVADDIGQDVGGWVADLINHLLGRGPDRDEAPGVPRFREGKASVC